MNNGTSDLYIKRTLTSDSNTYTEDELVKAADYIVVLAEPGAGKTELLKSLANQLKVKRVSANRLVNSQQVHGEEVLVIDAFDELAQTNHSGIYQLLDRIDELKPKKLVISSRSSEWGDGHQHAFEEYFESQPLVVRLSEFNEAEQQLLFYSHLPNESFEAFYDEVQRFNLDVLLPNPQFLGMFANAYIESNRKFANKKSIFEKAVERLAKESRPSINNHLVSSLSLSKKISITSEIFAGILLSGSVVA
ncbi:AAA family ATPase [Pseudoalteromonas piscicida]|uniref:nSTAND3 domain-containing NTPase n=1 Tax=Pseudoalteromonas piscicida TaxID=43662 RepID=UPI000372D019|nr:AAA family ATPase [Pseudoalteromonas piscicida]WPU33632.1 AAA family ATPase [Pseudoalteromonas piscicida]